MIGLIVHGGAWDIPDEVLEDHRLGVERALLHGWKLLSEGLSAADVVETVIMMLEDDPTFDAGRGSFVNAVGEIELDAAIMHGGTFRAGAVGAVQNIRHPISLARKVMEVSEHVMLVGSGAVRFAREVGIEQCRQEELLVGRELQRWQSLQRAQKFSTKSAFQHRGTVGAVALDQEGNLVAGTSTGGTPNKYPGRIGDSPLIGCGTYADNRVAGASATGWGEAIIKVVLAKTILDLMEHYHLSAQQAAEEGIRQLHDRADGYGGVIVLGKNGEIGCAFNTPRMARGYMTSAMDLPRIMV